MSIDPISIDESRVIPPVDLPRAEAAVRELLIAIGDSNTTNSWW